MIDIPGNSTERMQMVHDLDNKNLLEEFYKYEQEFKQNRLTPVTHEIYLYMLHELYHRRIGPYSTYPVDIIRDDLAILQDFKVICQKCWRTGIIDRTKIQPPEDVDAEFHRRIYRIISKTKTNPRIEIEYYLCNDCQEECR